ncbi:MAG: hypothetical protein HY849_11330 [Nitrosomonadales bacterium]|nr:hypothetical protein [Nitrosomonadales bacterium]
MIGKTWDVVSACLRHAMLALSLSLYFLAPTALAAQPPTEANATAVMKAFKQQEEAAAAAANPERDHQRQVIMFLLGAPLLVLLLITGGLGIAMGIYGKRVFVPHTIFAGLTMTLALVHVVVGLVWFYPF